MLTPLLDILILAGIGFAALLILGFILARLYKRASKEVAFVRTGFGGGKVVMDGGALVLPVFHETIPVNMNTLRLAVERNSEQALITKDRMRVDVIAEFYVRVQPSSDAISAAAQTLGLRTMHPEQLKELVEGKFVDALRSVAAELTMTELHEQRTHFVQKVQQVSSEDLLKNGLELESVSLTGLDQTAMEFFNPSNAFDAEGLTRLTEEIELRKKLRNDIEQDTLVQIKNKNLETERQTLTIGRDEEYARLEQQREVEIRRAAQAAEVAREQAANARAAEEAKIDAEKQIQQARIAMEQQVKEREIEKAKMVELSEQDRAIAVAEKSRAQSEAQAQADEARAHAVQAEERVITAREREAAERQKAIELIEAAREAEREAIAIKVAAEAEKAAATDRADAQREQAKGAADKVKIEANATAEAVRLAAEADRVRYDVDAIGQKAVNEAANVLSAEQIAMRIRLKLIENLDRIIAESVKPMESIDSIKIVQVDGLNGGGAAGAGGDGASSGNLADSVVTSALRYRAQAPLVDQLLAEVGLNARDLNGLTASLQPPATDTVPVVKTPKAKRADAEE